MSEQLSSYLASLIWRGIQIIPSEDIPNGYRRTEGNTIFVSHGNYALMKPLSAKGTLIMLGFLKEQK